MKLISMLTAVLMLLSPLAHADETETAPVMDEAAQQQAEYELWANQILASLNKQHGVIALPGTGATLTVSGAGSMAAGHRDSHPAVAAYGAGTPQPLPPRPQTTRWTGVPSVRSSDPRLSPVSAISRPSWG